MVIQMQVFQFPTFLILLHFAWLISQNLKNRNHWPENDDIVVLHTCLGILQVYILKQDTTRQNNMCN